MSAAIVWLGLPALKEKSPDAYQKLATISNKNVAATASNNSVGAGATGNFGSGTGADGDGFAADAGGAFGIGTDTSTFAGADAGGNIGSGGAGGGGNAARAAFNHPSPAAFISAPASAPVASAPAFGDGAAAPAADRYSALNDDPGYDWGVVVTNSFVYDEKMRQIGVIEGGTVIERVSDSMQPDGRVMRCHYLKERKWSRGTIIIYESDLAMFEGKYADANKAQRDIIIEYCQLSGKLEAQRAKLAESVASRNPHLAEYKTALREQREFYAKANATRAEAESASDASRTELTDQLRRMKMTEPDVNKRVSEAKKLYDEWLAQNVKPGLKTIEIQQLENRVKSLRPRAAQIVPGI